METRKNEILEKLKSILFVPLKSFFQMLGGILSSSFFFFFFFFGGGVFFFLLILITTQILHEHLFKKKKRKTYKTRLLSSDRLTATPIGIKFIFGCQIIKKRDVTALTPLALKLSFFVYY